MGNGPKPKNREDLETHIFDLFTNHFLKETSSDRRIKIKNDIITNIFILYRDFIYKKKIEGDEGFYVNTAHKMADIFYISINNLFTKEKNIEKIPREKKIFLKYISTRVFWAKCDYYRTSKGGAIKLSKHLMEMRKKIEKYLAEKEQELQRNLTSLEREQFVIDRFSITRSSYKKIERSYLLENGMELNENQEDADNRNTQSKKEQDLEIILNNTTPVMVKAILNNKILVKTKNKECYKEIFTLLCIKKYMDLQKFASVLDNKIIKMHQNGERLPTQGEIYLKYHKNTNNPDISGSNMKTQLISYLKAELLRRNVNHKESGYI